MGDDDLNYRMICNIQGAALLKGIGQLKDLRKDCEKKDALFMICSYQESAIESLGEMVCEIVELIPMHATEKEKQIREKFQKMRGNLSRIRREIDVLKKEAWLNDDS